MPAPEGGKTESGLQALVAIVWSPSLEFPTHTQPSESTLMCITRFTSSQANWGKILNPSELGLLNRNSACSTFCLLSRGRN